MKEALKKFINDKISKESKAKKSILQSILGIISDLNLKDDFVITWIDDAINDKIFKNLDFINGGNWHESLINKEYLPFMIELFECRPIGLGTPNAMCGEGELMLVLSSPKIKKPKQNDIQIGLNVYDIKNDLPRIFGESTGKKLNEKLLKLCLDLGFKPIEKKEKKTVQLVNKNYIENYWNHQFKTKNRLEVKKLLKSFFLGIFPSNNTLEKEVEKIIDIVLIDNQLCWDKWIKQLIIFIYKNSEENTSNLVLMKSTGQINTIPNNFDDFEKLVLNDIIKFNVDYFRMNQNFKVGVYINFVD